MPHPRGGDKPHKLGGTNSPASRKKKAEQMDRQERRARWRYQIIRYIYDNDLAGLPKTQIHQHVQQAYDDGNLELMRAPSYGSIRRWMKKAEDLYGGEKQRAVHLTDWFDDGRPGRPPKEFDDRLEEFLRQELLISQYTSVAELHRMVKQKAKALEVEAPSYDWVKRFRDRMDPEKLAAAKHGRRAAMADMAPKLTVPAEQPHETWTLDEKQAPVWIRAYHPTKKEYVAVKPQIILVIDNYSRAVVSYRVVEPFRYGANVSYNEEDVLGTLMSGFFKELAPPATRDFAGYAPLVLRWDRHSTHRALANRLDNYGIHVPEVPGATPWAQGKAERLIASMKALCQHITGWDQKYSPASEMREEPGKTRSKAATTSFRETTKIPLATRRLLNYRQFTEAFDEQVREYNNREHSVIGAEPEIAYFNALEPDVCRVGYDVLPLLETRTFRMTKKGLTYRKERFAWESGGRMLRVGETVTGKPDPLLRGLFIQVDGAWEFMPNMEDYARKADHKKLTIESHRRAKEYSLEARQARQERQEDILGADGVAETEAEMEATLNDTPYRPNSVPLPEDAADISEEEPEDADAAEEAPDDVDEPAPKAETQSEETDEDELEERRRHRRGLRSPSERIRRAE